MRRYESDTTDMMGERMVGVEGDRLLRLRNRQVELALF